VPGRLLLAVILITCGVAHYCGISLFMALLAGAAVAIGYLCLWSILPNRAQSQRRQDD
jgi:hypothetical protein